MIAKSLLRTQSDARLVELARAGNEAAFEAIVARYRRPLEHYSRRLLRQPGEDVVQQAFISAWSALRRGTEVRALRPWLYQITRHAVLRSARGAAAPEIELTEVVCVDHAGPQSVLEQRERLRSALDAVADLPPRQREALVMTVGGQRQREVARVLGVSELAARQLVHRARNAVRAAATAVIPFPLATRIAAHAAGETGGAAALGGMGGVLVKGAAMLATGVAVGSAPALVVAHAAAARPHKVAATVAGHESGPAGVSGPDNSSALRPADAAPRGGAARPHRDHRHKAGGGPTPSGQGVGGSTGTDQVSYGDPSAGDASLGDTPDDGSAHDPSAVSDPGQGDPGSSVPPPDEPTDPAADAAPADPTPADGSPPPDAAPPSPTP